MSARVCIQCLNSASSVRAGHPMSTIVNPMFGLSRTAVSRLVLANPSNITALCVLVEPFFQVGREEVDQTNNRHWNGRPSRHPLGPEDFALWIRRQKLMPY